MAQLWRGLGLLYREQDQKRQRPYLQYLPRHRGRRLEVDRGVDGWGGGPSQLLLLLLLHVMHGGLLLHALSLLLLLRLLPHELHAQPDA